MMKKLFLMAMVAVSATAFADEVNNEEVLMSTQDEPSMMVDDEDNNGGVRIKMNKDDESSDWTMHFSVGVNIPMDAPDGVDLATFKSWEFNWTILQYDYTPKNTKTTLSAGVGLNFRNYGLSGHDKMFGKIHDQVVVGTPSRDIDNLYSSIHTTGLYIPLLVKQRFSKNFAISLGGQLNWNYAAHVSNQYETGDDEVDVETNKIGQRPITVDVLGIFHIWKLGLYCKYSPMSVLKTDRGPEFKSLAVGIYF